MNYLYTVLITVYLIGIALMLFGFNMMCQNNPEKRAIYIGPKLPLLLCAIFFWPVLYPLSLLLGKMGYKV